MVENDQTICAECQTKKRVSIRTIEGSGGYMLCDSCYRKLFPATAMFEATQNGSFVRNSVVKISSDINRRIEKLKSSAIEEEECHQCLEKGSFRRCCKKFYCRTCYFKFSKCPGCNTPCHRSGVGGNMALDRPPSRLAVLSSLCLAILIGFAISSAMTIIIMNNTVKKQKTVWMHSCRGWWWENQCKTPMCIDFPMIETNTSDALSDFFPYEYGFCKADKTVNQILGYGCIFDHELYKRSNNNLGFDICIETQSDNGAQLLTSTGSIANKFDHRIVVFEDTFDYWLDSTNFNSSILASSKWNRMMNARASNICGYSNQTLAYESNDETYHRPKKTNESSLVFTGFNFRYAETQDLDLSSGGSIEFGLKMGPIVDSNIEYTCKTVFGGQIALLYSIDKGLSWRALRDFPIWKYRSNIFQAVRIELPEQGWSSSIRFKWEQVSFDPQRDYWAIDDLRIYHRFHPSWQSSAKVMRSSEQHHEQVRLDQCCYDSVQCTTFPNDKVCAEFKQFRFHGIHVYMLLSILAGLARSFISDMSDPEQYPLEGDTKIVPLALDVSTKFQVLALCGSSVLPISAFAVLCQHFSRRWHFYSQNSIEFAFLFIMMIMDLNTLRVICRDVICFWPFRKLPLVYFTATDESVQFSIAEKWIPLSDVISIDSLSLRLHKLLTVMTFVTTSPLFSCMLLNNIMKYPFEIKEVITHFLGICTLFRSILGALWMVQLFLIFTWMFTSSFKNRDVMGRALQRPFIQHISSKTAMVFIAAANLRLMTRFGGDVTWNKIIIHTIFALIGGIVFGSTVGMLRYLPVNCSPLTFKVTSWPSSHSLSFSTLIAKDGIVRLHVLHLKDSEVVRSILNGSTDIYELSSPSESESVMDD